MLPEWKPGQNLLSLSLIFRPVHFHEINPFRGEVSLSSIAKEDNGCIPRRLNRGCCALSLCGSIAENACSNEPVLVAAIPYTIYNVLYTDVSCQSRNEKDTWWLLVEWCLKLLCHDAVKMIKIKGRETECTEPRGCYVRVYLLPFFSSFKVDVPVMDEYTNNRQLCALNVDFATDKAYIDDYTDRWLEHLPC